MPRGLTTRLFASSMGLSAVGLSLLAGCGDPCGDLQEICDLCVDPNQKAACEASVDAGTDDVCEQDLDSYGNVCL
ncbi:MAG TPA: hypothetical protein ENK57_24140 [Polyangiaceae bacterium]|nr:hypothetical protein [Polyangiaceae bacterium]